MDHSQVLAGPADILGMEIKRRHFLGLLATNMGLLALKPFDGLIPKSSTKGQWVIPEIQVSNHVDQTIDLSHTLPPGMKYGGKFYVDSRGKSLPQGITLSSNGILSVKKDSANSVEGVIFAYHEPFV